MANILLVEDASDLGVYEAKLLEEIGHTVLRCSGGPTPFSVCPMMRGTACAVADAADIIIFSCRLFGAMRGRSYGGVNLLRAYRRHPSYGRLPMLIVGLGMPRDLEGSGRVRLLEKFSEPKEVIRAVDELLSEMSVPSTR